LVADEQDQILEPGLMQAGEMLVIERPKIDTSKPSRRRSFPF
jgi:hypothetical protein